MTFESLQAHEAFVLAYLQRDYRRKNLERLVQEYVTGRRVLDVRCLTGHLAVDLARKGFEVTALDAHVKGVELSNRHAREQGLPGEIARLWDLEHLLEAVGVERFDTVICLDTLNHVDHDELLLAQIASVLVDGGRLILAVPAHPALYGPRDRWLGHRRRYTRRGIQERLDRQGLSIRVHRYWNVLGLLPYLVIERVMKRQIPERLRYGRAGSLPHRLLRWWYGTIENRLRFPTGLSHVIVAQKERNASGFSAKHPPGVETEPFCDPTDGRSVS